MQTPGIEVIMICCYCKVLETGHEEEEFCPCCLKEVIKYITEHSNYVNKK